MVIELIKGEIDEVQQVVSIGWVQPLILDAKRIGLLNKRLSGSKVIIRKVFRHLEGKLKEFLE
jgi:hypothetical protein